MPHERSMRRGARRMLVACLLASMIGITAADQVVFGNAGQPTLPIDAPRHVTKGQYTTRFPDVMWDNDDWTLTTSTLRPNDFRAMAFTANGYFGSSMASTGPFFQSFAEVNGWPVENQRQTFGTVSGFFDRQVNTTEGNFEWLQQQGWDSVISGIPHWGPLILETEDGSYLAANTSADELSKVQLVQDFKLGLAKWQYTWSPGGNSNASMDIIYVALADKLHINRGYVYLSVKPTQDTSVTIYSILDGQNAVRTNFSTSGTDGNMVYTAVKPEGVDNVTAWMYSAVVGSSNLQLSAQNFTGEKDFIGKAPSTVAQSFNLTLKAGEDSTFLKHVGVASTDGFSDPQSQARDAVMKSVNRDYETILKDHAKEWRKTMPKTSVVDYTDPTTGLIQARPELIEKSIVSVVSTFSILMNTISTSALSLVGNAAIDVNGISVCGITSDCYGGQRFWDEDVWMHPGLSAMFPAASKQITNNRVHQYPQAKANVKTAFTSSQNQTTFSDNAAVYPWTSGRDANCTSTGPCFDYEYHLNGDIIHSFISQWTSSGDTKYLKNELYPIMRSISTLFSDMLIKNDSTWQLMNMTDPDEYYNHINNGAFTMPLIATVFNQTNAMAAYFGDTVNTTWKDQAKNILIPREGDLSKEYDQMNGSIVAKQADVVLKIYPLDPETDYSIAQQQADLDYYAGHQSPNGPGMTWAIFSIAANAISASGCSAYTYDTYSWSPYLRAPWFSFSEQLNDDSKVNGGTNPAYPFLTGHGGFLQVDIYGYLGLRRTLDWTLRLDPSVPPQISHIAYPTFYHHGWPIQARANTTHTTLSRGREALTTANQTFAGSPIQVVVKKANFSDENVTEKTNTYSLPPGGTIEIPNRQYSENKTEPGNILQCRDVWSPTPNVPGLFARAAIDGAASTLWQGDSKKATATLTVDTQNVPFQQLKYASFNWAQQPPDEVSIILHNYTDWSSGQRINITNIDVSLPYKGPEDKIVPYEGNTTKVNFDQPVWSSNYVTLMVTGNQGNTSDNAPGATVAEFALVPM